MADLNVMLYGLSPIVNATDVTVWPFDISKGFTVRSYYAILNQALRGNKVDSRRKLGAKHYIKGSCSLEIEDYRLKIMLLVYSVKCKWKI